MALKMEPKVRIYLVVNHEAVTSGELARILGLAPDESWDKGSPFYRGDKERHRRYNRWSVVELIDDLTEMQGAVDRLASRVNPIRKNFACLPLGSRIGFTLELTTEQLVFGIALTREQIRFWASIGADVDMSIVVLTPPPSEATR